MPITKQSSSDINITIKLIIIQMCVKFLNVVKEV